ncbi:MAG: hypothetical protein JST76_04685 [Bacteroidetes bacterium]|nr:hypothetical protein [Bacteroidota bacterium]
MNIVKFAGREKSLTIFHNRSQSSTSQAGGESHEQGHSGTREVGIAPGLFPSDCEANACGKKRNHMQRDTQHHEQHKTKLLRWAATDYFTNYPVDCQYE